jgi:hypothetical protein
MSKLSRSTTFIRCSRLAPVALLIFLSFTIAGCLAIPSVLVAENAPDPSTIESVFLLPLNFDSTPPHILLRGTEVVERELITYLESTGREVLQIKLRDLLRYWRKVVAETEGLSRANIANVDPALFEAAHSDLIRLLMEHHSADAVAMPALAVRQGYFNAMILAWDGVRRRVTVVNEKGSTVMVNRMSGKGAGTSLHMTLFTPQGEQFFERYAGIEPTISYTLGGFGSAGGGQIRGHEREDLFRDTAIVQDAVALSFSPFFKPPPEAENAANE